jgi:C4-type Zn-finger protein
MKHFRPIVNVEAPTTVSDAQVIACPACSAQLTFHRSNSPHIDECGFESYSLECKECGVPLAGIIDPFDETLLLTQIAA